MRLRRQQADHDDEIALAHHRRQIDQRRPLGRHRFGRGVRVSGEQAQTERTGEAHDLAADAAGADDAERAADQAHAHVTGLFGPAALAGQLVLGEQFLRQRHDKGQRRHRHRAAHAVRLVRDDDAVIGTGGQIDRVVADAVARQYAGAHRAVAETGPRDARRVDVDGIVAAQDRRRQFAHRFRDDLPFDVRLGIQYAHRLVAERQFAARIEQIARQPDLEFFHRPILPSSISSCGLPPRQPPAALRRPVPRVARPARAARRCCAKSPASAAPDPARRR